MSRSPARSFSRGLLLLFLSSTGLLGGCGGSSNPEFSTGQPPPKDRIEALQRFKEASIKHDESAPKNQRSGVKK